MRHALLLTLALVTSGCAVQRQPEPEPAEADEILANPAFITPDIYANRTHVDSRERDQVRTGRYTLTSTLPSAAQEDLMAQIIEVTIPSSLKPTVGDAIRHALSRSGYTLDSDNTQASVLYSRSLPAAHYKLGPMRLRDTLQVLAGPAWKVSIDEVTRQVNFSLRPGYQLPTPPKQTPTLLAQRKTLPNSNQPLSASAALSDTKSTAVPSPPAITASSTTAKAMSAKPSATRPASASDVGAPAGVGTPPRDAEALKKPSTGAVAPGYGATQTTSSTSATSATPVPTPTPRPLSQIWTAETGSTLRQSVENWAKKADWTLLWEQDDLDYPIAATLRFEGSFEEAIKQLFPLYDKAPRSFVVDGSAAQRLVHIAERKKK